MNFAKLPVPLLIFLLALAARVAVALWLPDSIIWFDGERYELIARSLLRGDGFGTLYDNSKSVPTQPLLMAGIYWVFGHDFQILRIAFATLGAASCVVGYAIARRLFGARVATLAGVGLALYPHLVYLSALFEYPQTLFILLTGLFFLFLLRFQETRRASDVVCAGLALGLATLTVATMLLYVPLAVALVWYYAGKPRWLATALLVLACSLPIGSWALRNQHAWGQPILINASGGFNFWIANNDAYYERDKDGLWDICIPGEYEKRQCRVRLELSPAPPGGDLTQRVLEIERLAWAQGKHWVYESPGRFVLLSLRRFRNFWSPVPDALTNNEGAGGSARTLISIASYVPVALAALVGLFLSRASWRRLLPIYGFFCVLMGAHSIFLPAMRYRLPLDCFLVIFAAFAVWTLWERRRAASAR